MAATPSNMLPLGTKAPPFALPATDGKIVSLAQFAGKKALCVIFMCNHCPFVKHIATRLAAMALSLEKKGVQFVGINANDVERYPADGPDEMRKEKTAQGYIFPYLLDTTQAVAKAYLAACTPDIYLFDDKLLLKYRGQFDDSRPGDGKPVDGASLAAAIEALLANKEPSSQQKPSIGCNIKWKPGNEPEYFHKK